MTKKFQLLPLAIVVMSMVLGIKIVDFSFGVEEAFASSSETAPESVKEEKASEHEDAGQEKAGQENHEAAPAPRQLSSIPTRKEIEYLQKLANRRVELDRRSREMDDREKLLQAVELRIIERTKSLKKIEATIEAALKERDRREKAQLDSLVKMYSSMKPKEAAQIFNSLEDKILLSIVENMKEKKMGAILAKMNLDKAKKLTINLATSENLPDIEG